MYLKSEYPYNRNEWEKAFQFYQNETIKMRNMKKNTTAYILFFFVSSYHSSFIIIIRSSGLHL